MTSGHIRLRSAPGRWVLLTTVLGSGMATLDGTVVNVALPALGRDLHAGMSGLQWTVNAYTLTMAALILLGGSLGDRLGRRRSSCSCPSACMRPRLSEDHRQHRAEKRRCWSP
ncbi:MFS transporter, partial [Microbispora rosea]